MTYTVNKLSLLTPIEQQFRSMCFCGRWLSSMSAPVQPFHTHVYTGVRSFSSEPVDFYKVLNVQRNASPLQIKLSYFALAKAHHPDSTSSEKVDDFLKVVEAYECLSCPKRRREYDISLQQTRKKRPGRVQYKTETQLQFGFTKPYRPG